MIKNNQKRIQNKNIHRDDSIDLIKGIGMICVVLGHSYFPFTRWIYLFHMSLFFITSGFLWKDEHASSIASCANYIKRKIRSLWVPYVVANGMFALLNNFFIDVGFYTSNPLFLTITSNPHNYLQDYLSIKDTLVLLIKVLLFFGDIQMGGVLGFYERFLRCRFFI